MEDELEEQRKADNRYYGLESQWIQQYMFTFIFGCSKMMSQGKLNLLYRFLNEIGCALNPKATNLVKITFHMSSCSTVIK